MVLHFVYSLLRLYGYDSFLGESSSLNFLAPFWVAGVRTRGMPECSLKYLPKNEALAKCRSSAIGCKSKHNNWNINVLCVILYVLKVLYANLL